MTEHIHVRSLAQTANVQQLLTAMVSRSKEVPDERPAGGELLAEARLVDTLGAGGQLPVETLPVGHLVLIGEQ